MNKPAGLLQPEPAALGSAARSSPPWILTLSCADRVGIVAAVSGFLADRDGFIIDSQQFADLETSRFFMRVSFKSGGPRFTNDEASLCAAFEPVAASLGFDWALVSESRLPRILIAVSKGSHCLNDLLHRWRTGTLPAHIVGVVSNHPDLRPLAEWHGVPFHHLPLAAGADAEQEAAMLALFRTLGADLLVLARYMRILSPRTAGALEGRCINIHHSFLPSFKGARPYHGAHASGVKLIGATAHFVSDRLDEGPIIEQAVERVDHRASIEDFVKLGRDIESQVLARALTWVAERRVFRNGRRTVVFR